MSTSYFGDNLIPGVSVKNINSAIINPMLNLGNQMGQAYNSYGQNLRNALGQNQNGYEELFLSGQLPGQKPLPKRSADIRGSMTPGSSQPAATNLGEGAAMDAAERFREGAGFPAGVTRPSNYPVAAPVVAPAPVSTPATGKAKLDPNATEEYKTAFNIGQKKMDDMLEYFGSQNNGENLKKWAELHPALAYKEYKKAGMTAKEPFGYDEVVYGKLQEKDNPQKAAKKLGIKIFDGQADDTRTPQEKFAQAFLGDAIKGLKFGKYGNLDANPYQIDPAAMLNQPVDFNIPGLEKPLGNYGTADYGELLKKYPNIFSYK